MNDTGSNEEINNACREGGATKGFNSLEKIGMIAE